MQHLEHLSCSASTRLQYFIPRCNSLSFRYKLIDIEITKLRFLFSIDCRYTESLYALFSIGGLYHLMSGKDIIAVPWLALSGFARSNGVTNAGYICFQTMHQAYNAILRKSAFVSLLCIF